MGNIDLSMYALVSSLGVKIVMPPKNSNEALEIGVKNSIEGSRAQEQIPDRRGGMFLCTERGDRRYGTIFDTEL